MPEMNKTNSFSSAVIILNYSWGRNSERNIVSEICLEYHQ